MAPVADGRRSEASIGNASGISRVLPLDGLRGLLALGVFVNHAAIYRHYPTTGIWATDSVVCSQLGQLGVSLFFMITAYLFYGRLIRDKGRPDWLRLYVGRVFRIAPVYLLAVAAMFAIVAVLSGFRLQVSATELGSQIADWLALGAGPCPDLNTYSDTRHLLAGVTWTLRSEWLFYTALPLLALAARNVARDSWTFLLLPALGLPVAFAAIAILGPAAFPACIAPFLIGMGCAAAQATHAMPRVPSWVASAFVVVGFAIILGFGLNPRLPTALLLSGATFFLIVEDADLFGLLTCQPVRWLGEISYDIYLLHGLVLSRFFAIPAVRDRALGSVARHLSLTACAVVLVVALASLAHRLVERPGIRLGRAACARLRPSHRTLAQPKPAALTLEHG